MTSVIRKPFQHRVYSNRKEFPPRGANYSLKLTPVYKGDKNEIG